MLNRLPSPRLVPFGISPARYPADAACIGGASGHAWDHSTGGVDGSGETQRGGAASAAAVATWVMDKNCVVKC